MAPLASDDVAVVEVEYQTEPDLHRRYGIEAAPVTIVVDAEGVTRASFAGAFTATDLWAKLAELRALSRGLRVRPRSAAVAYSSVPSAWTILRGPPTLWPIAVSTRSATSSRVERLAFEERLGDRVEAGAVLDERLAAAVLFLAEDALDLFVDDACGLVRVVA